MNPVDPHLVRIRDALVGEGGPDPLREGFVAVDWLVARVHHHAGAAAGLRLRPPPRRSAVFFRRSASFRRGGRAEGCGRVRSEGGRRHGGARERGGCCCALCGRWKRAACWASLPSEDAVFDVCHIDKGEIMSHVRFTCRHLALTWLGQRRTFAWVLYLFVNYSKIENEDAKTLPSN